MKENNAWEHLKGMKIQEKLAIPYFFSLISRYSGKEESMSLPVGTAEEGYIERVAASAWIVHHCCD